MNILVNALVSAAVSSIVGIALWRFLPRSVAVLTRELYANDTWRIRNDSPVSVQLLEVTVTGVSTIDCDGNIKAIPVDWDGSGIVNMTLDDESDEIGRCDWGKPWSEIVLRPGDTMSARVGNNTSLHIRYQRAGRFGRFERRGLTISGGV